MDAATREAVRAAFGDAAARAAEAGIDLLLLDMADGYLLASFLSPLANGRNGAAIPGGGRVVGQGVDEQLSEDPVQYPLDILASVRAAWPGGRPLAVRLVADDRFSGGLTAVDGVVLARRLANGGADLIDVAAGHTVPEAGADYRRLFNVGLADRVRNEAGVAVAVGGHITRLDEVNTILAAGRADLCRLDPARYSRGTPPPETRRGALL